MSHKKERIVLLLALLLTLGLVGVGAWGFKDYFSPQFFARSDENHINDKINNKSITGRISFGEKTLIPEEISPSKKAGIEAFAAKKYKEAIANFEASLQSKRNDPETLIFLNNARIGTSKSYTIAVCVPIEKKIDYASEMLRGVAQAQNEINTLNNEKTILLKVAIVNDEPEFTKQIASALVQNEQILGVVGHFSSDSTLIVKDIYNAGKLVAISPTSTSTKLTNSSPYIFRTVPSDFVAARSLANYMITKLQLKNVAVFFNSQSEYSQSLKSEFATAVSLEGGQVLSEFDLSKPNFNPALTVEQVTKQGTQVLMLASDDGKIDQALQIVQLNKKRLPILAGDDNYTPKTLEVGGDAAVGMVVAVPWHIDASTFSSQSKKLWGADVNWRTATSYDATRVFIAALERNPTRFGVQQSLASRDFSTTGASGIVRFLPSGDRSAPEQLVKIAISSQSKIGYNFVPVAQSKP